MEIFCDIINVFSVTFDQFNASLMTKKKYFKKILLTPIFWVEVSFSAVWELRLILGQYNACLLVVLYSTVIETSRYLTSAPHLAQWTNSAYYCAEDTAIITLAVGRWATHDPVPQGLLTQS